MPNHTFQAIIVTGIREDADHYDGIVISHKLACEMFESGLVTNLSPVGHNFIQSFAVLPSGSGQGRDPQIAHAKAIDEFCKAILEFGVDFVAVKWNDQIEPPFITDFNN